MKAILAAVLFSVAALLSAEGAFQATTGTSLLTTEASARFCPNLGYCNGRRWCNYQRSPCARGRG
jgi:hypothetical protein